MKARVRQPSHDSGSGVVVLRDAPVRAFDAMKMKEIGSMRYSHPRFAMLSCVLFVLPVAPALAEQGRIYWTEYQFLNNQLNSMNLDGADFQTVPLPDEFLSTFTVAVDPESQRAFVLHTSPAAFDVSSVHLNSGAAIETLFTVGQPLGLGIERELHRLYVGDRLGGGCGNGIWAYDYEADQLHFLFAGCLKSLDSNPVADPTDGRVYFVWFGLLVSIAADGSDLTTVSQTPIEPSGLALHPEAGHIYWLEFDGDLWRMDYDGMGATLVAAALHPPGQGGSLQIDRVNCRFYWTDLAEKAIKSARLDGSDLQTLYSAPAEMNLGGIDVVVQPRPSTPGDITGDGAVDVDDLVAAILGWGPCPTRGNCPADIAPAPGGDGAVNADDLVMVILNWT
jgi:hypothetical protein